MLKTKSPTRRTQSADKNISYQYIHRKKEIDSNEFEEKYLIKIKACQEEFNGNSE